jgi:hypothetical protein
MMRLSEMRAELSGQVAELERAERERFSFFDGTERRTPAPDPRLPLVRSLYALVDTVMSDFDVLKRLQPRLWPAEGRPSDQGDVIDWSAVKRAARSGFPHQQPS